MLLVNGKATCSRLVVKIIIASQWPLVQGKAICPISRSRLFVRGHFVRGYFVRGKAACQWQVAQVMAACPRLLSKSRLLSMATCPSQSVITNGSICSMARLLYGDMGQQGAR